MQSDARQDDHQRSGIFDELGFESIGFVARIHERNADPVLLHGGQAKQHFRQPGVPWHGGAELQKFRIGFGQQSSET